MKALLLILVCTFLPLLGTLAQTLPAYGYTATLLPRKNHPMDVILFVHESGRIDLSLTVFDSPTSHHYQTFYGFATNKPNGLIVGKLPGRGLFRARVNPDGLSAKGRLRMLTKDREHVWFSRRVDLKRFQFNWHGGVDLIQGNGTIQAGEIILPQVP